MKTFLNKIMSFENEKKTIREIVEENKGAVEELTAFLPWLLKKSGHNAMANFQMEGKESSIPIPTYDPSLLAFVKALDNTGKMNRNYDYSYKRNRIYDEFDEISIIRRAQIQNIDLIFDILSAYVIKGRTKGRVWNKGVENGVYLEAVKKLKELMDLWKEPGQ